MLTQKSFHWSKKLHVENILQMRSKCMSCWSRLVFSLHACFSVMVSIMTAPLHKVCMVPLVKPVQVLVGDPFPPAWPCITQLSVSKLAMAVLSPTVPQIWEAAYYLHITYRHLFSTNGLVWTWAWSRCVNSLYFFPQEEFLQVQSTTDAYPGRNTCAPALGGVFGWIHRPILLCLCFHCLCWDCSSGVLWCHCTGIAWAGETSVSLFIKSEQQSPKECGSNYRLRSWLL